MVAGYVDDRHRPEELLPGGKIWARSPSSRDRTRHSAPPHRGRYVERRNRMPMATCWELRFAGHIIEEVANTYERVCGRVCLRKSGRRSSSSPANSGPGRKPDLPAPVEHGRGHDRHRVSSPIMLLKAIAVRLSSPGPVLYRQTRVGLDDTLLYRVQVRSMRLDAEAATARSGAEDDPRVTRGAHHPAHPFRRTAPVVQCPEGEMSIVGPRPERPEFVRALSEQIPYTGSVIVCAPGSRDGHRSLQVRRHPGRHHHQARVRLYYIKNMSIALDNSSSSTLKGHAVVARPQ